MAVYPVTPGAPDYSTGSTNQYIPAIYSALLVKKFYPNTVWGECSNTLYEGDIKSSGDTVYIRTRPTIDTFKYKKGMVLPVQNPESAYVTLKIDQGEGFSFAIDKVDEFQSDIKLMNVWAEDAAQQMKQVIDRKVLGMLAGDTTHYDALLGTANVIRGGATAYTSVLGNSFTLGYATSWTSSNSTATHNIYNSTMSTFGNNVLERILFYGRILDENAIPDEDRFVILPPVAIQALKMSELRQAYLTGDTQSTLRNGKVGKVDRFNIFASNNLASPTSGEYAVVFGHKYGLTFATQITESRIIDNPFSFGKMMQGLQVYGMSCIKAHTVGVELIDFANAS